MKTSRENCPVYLVGELLEQALESARQKLSGDAANPTPVPRIGRRLRERRPPPPSPAGGTSAFQDPASSWDDLCEFAQRLKEEVSRIEEREEWIRRSEEARRLRDATDEKKAR